MRPTATDITWSVSQASSVLKTDRSAVCGMDFGRTKEPYITREAQIIAASLWEGAVWETSPRPL